MRVDPASPTPEGHKSNHKENTPLLQHPVPVAVEAKRPLTGHVSRSLNENDTAAAKTNRLVNHLCRAPAGSLTMSNRSCSLGG